MRKYIVLMVAWVISLSGVSFAGDIAWEEIGRGILGLRVVAVDPANPNIIYAGSGKGVFKSQDYGESWKNILLVRGQSRVVNFLFLDSEDKNSLYAATGNGLFYSQDQGKNWVRIFKGKDYFENECTTLAVLPYAIYLGTRNGLFVSSDQGRSWVRERGVLGKTNILNIAYSSEEPSDIYVAAVACVFKTKDSGQSWEKIFLAKPCEDGNNGTEEQVEDYDTEEQFSGIRYVSIDRNSGDIYLATSNGVYKSIDKGQSFGLLSGAGLLHEDIQFLFISSQSKVYALIESGVFELKGDRWQEISFGLATGEVRFLTSDNQGNLYAACDKGLFRASPRGPVLDSPSDIIASYLQGEPRIQEVQQAAIKYAEVEPEKILNWRKQAAKKAWLPEVSLGIDRNTGDLWHWESGSTTRADDDVLRQGKETIDWDISLSWDLSDLIFNDAQTSIDVRSRLMVELRDDILDEVTKIYFERIRLKMELDNLSLEDRKKRFEKELRLKELTASLDALTGGYFSTKARF